MAGGAGDLHALGMADPPTRLVRVLEVDRPALVLGSTQSSSVADAGACASGGVDLVRRRSGGGAVLVEPGGLVWVDVVVPAGDPLWSDDVGKAFLWLGEAWCRAVSGFAGMRAAKASLRVHTGGLLCPNRWSRLVCFAGVAPGEVLVGRGQGAKVLGMAQRRTRSGALFQCALPLAWEPGRLLSLMALSGEERSRGAVELTASVAPVGDAAPEDVVQALVGELPR